MDRYARRGQYPRLWLCAGGVSGVRGKPKNRKLSGNEVGTHGGPSYIYYKSPTNDYFATEKLSFFKSC